MDYRSLESGCVASYFFLLIWNWFVEYLAYILSKILEKLKPAESGSTPNGGRGGVSIDPDSGKYGDIQNKEYLNNLLQNLDDYKFYVLITIGIVAVGIVTYTYWDSIMNKFGYPRGADENVYLPSPIPSDPSSGRNVEDYPDGYLSYF